MKLTLNLDRPRSVEALADNVLIVRSDRICVAALHSKLIVPLSTGRRYNSRSIGVLPSVVGSGIIRAYLPPRPFAPCPRIPTVNRQRRPAVRGACARARFRFIPHTRGLGVVGCRNSSTNYRETGISGHPEGPLRDAPLSRPSSHPLRAPSASSSSWMAGNRRSQTSSLSSSTWS